MIDNAVLKARNHQEWKVEYMNWCAYEMDHRIEKRHARECLMAELFPEKMLSGDSSEPYPEEKPSS